MEANGRSPGTRQRRSPGRSWALPLAAVGLLAAVGVSARAEPRIVVWLPAECQDLERPLLQAFERQEPARVLSPGALARRYPPSAETREREERQRELAERVREAEESFVAMRLDEAARALEASEGALERLPPTAAGKSLLLRLRLLEARVHLARRAPDRAARAFEGAAEAAPDASLDEGEFPPEVRAAFAKARERVQAAPTRELSVTSEPAGAELELNGQLVGRTPAVVPLPSGRCVLSVALPGRQPFAGVCPAGATLSVSLSAAGLEERREQLRERLRSDRQWFLEPLLLDALAAEEGVKWVVILERTRGQGLQPLVYSAGERALKPLGSSRFAETELDALAAAVAAVVRRAQAPGAASAALDLGGRPAPEATAPRRDAWYSRWYVWAAAGVVLAGAVAGTYWALRPDEVTITFGAER